MTTGYAYPQQLAAFIDEHWDDYIPGADLPPLPVLESLLSIAFQASLLRDEERPVVFRLILAAPDTFPSEAGPPTGLHQLCFAEPIVFSPQEIKPLASAASFHRSLIGVHFDRDGALQMWGLVNSGPRWLHTQHGGRGSAPELPPNLVVNITGPGCIEVCKGATTIRQLGQGRVFGPSVNVLQAPWLQDMFAQTRAERMVIHQQARAAASAPWYDLDPELTHIIDQHMVKRVLAAIRAFKHGGTLIMVPPEMTDELLGANKYLSIRYPFADGEPRARFRTLIISVMNALAASDGNGDCVKEQHVIGWQQYQESLDATVAALDESIFEMSHLIAALSTVDGAVVMTRRFELLGFGAEIRCDLSEVTSIARSLNLEGTKYKIEQTRGVGTRHRSAYNLCHVLKDVLAIVISQDGGVRFIRSNNETVMYWDHQATFAFSHRF
ncbi:MAG: diadenylate cyclase [Candidatus Obscuribacterales bacterium]|nr:diadenylate cyclase [Candidatus Obscuribacterales bacterium]